MQRTTVEALLGRYDVFFLDLYGVLVHAGGALPGAASFLRRLEEAGKQHLCLTNDASRLPPTAAARYRRFGLPLREDRIVTSGMLLADHYGAAGLHGAPSIVLGPEDSAAYVQAAGGRIVPPDDVGAEVVVVADDDGFPFVETMNAVITTLYRRLDAGRSTRVIVPNPDLVYPRANGAVGFTAGAMAALLQAVLTLRDPSGGPPFVTLGKPHPPMFEAAVRRVGLGGDRSRIVMVGDQLPTDIRGARDAGIDSVLVEGGVGRADEITRHGVQPTWLLAGLDQG